MSILTTQSDNAVTFQQCGNSRTRLDEFDKLTIKYLYQQPNWRFVDPDYTGFNGPSDGSFLRPFL